MNINFRNKTILGIISLTAFLLSITNVSAQNINFNYATSGLSTADCNIFNPAITVQGYTHTTIAAAPVFNGTSINVPVIYSSISNVYAGTGYAISYSFTASHGYAIGVNVNADINNSGVSWPYFKAGLSSSLPSTSALCGGYPGGYSNSAFSSIYSQILSATNSIQIPAFIGSGQTYLLIGAYPSNSTSSYHANVDINSISISDVPPITPSTASLQCSGSSQVFSVNTPYPISWATSPSGILTLTPSGSSVTATATTNTGYIVTITASVNTPNGIVT